MNSFRVLHLSDFHFRVQDKHHWNRMLELLVHQVIASTSPDLVITTGDIAFRAMRRSSNWPLHGSAKTWYQRYQSLVTAISSVPGNHDVDRSVVSTLTKQLRPKQLNDVQTSLTEGLNNHAERDIIERPFQRYLDSARRWTRAIPRISGSGMRFQSTVFLLLSPIV